MTTPRLSILIPTYKRGEWIGQTLESLATQTYLPDNLEVIVADDASGDRTPEVVASYMGRIPGLRFFQHEANIGGNRNWSFTLDRATGDLAFVLCDDDAVAPDFLETYLHLFAADPTLDMVTGDVELRNVQFEPMEVLHLPTAAGPADGPTRVRDQLFSHHMVMGTMYRRSLLLDAGGWDPRVGTHFDCTAYCRAALRARGTYRVDRPMLRFRVSPGSWSHRMVTAQQGQLARWYRQKLDLLVEDARERAPDLLPDLRRMYLWHARTVIAYLEIELAHGRLSGAAARAALRELVAVFPEARYDRLAWKLRLVSVAGTGWLTALRKAIGRPDPYRSQVALFNSTPAG